VLEQKLNNCKIEKKKNTKIQAFSMLIVICQEALHVLHLKTRIFFSLYFLILYSSKIVGVVEFEDSSNKKKNNQGVFFSL